MPFSLPRILAVAALAVLAACTGKGEEEYAAGDNVVNLYTARHYDSDARVYEAFTKETGIRVRRIEAPAAQLIERMKAEGASSPADVLVIAPVDEPRETPADDEVPIGFGGGEPNDAETAADLEKRAAAALWDDDDVVLDLSEIPDEEVKGKA